jgi:hypothetical protein
MSYDIGYASHAGLDAIWRKGAKSEADPAISAYETEYYGMDHAEIGGMLA